MALNWSHLLLNFCTILGSLGGLIILHSWLVKNIFRKRYLKRNISRLTAAVTITYFIEILGSPTFINTMADSKQYIFVDKLFYVGVFVDENEKVTAFSVTTRSESFNPILKLGPYSLDSSELKITLGKSKFTDIDYLGHEGKVFSSLGARRAWYVETYYFGNPGNYQTYSFSQNQAGFLNDTKFEAVHNLGAETSSDPRLQKFRKNNVVNTYTITEPLLVIDSIDASPDYDQVRILN